MKIDLNYFPYMEKINQAPIEDRLDIACEYIDFTLNQFFKYSFKITNNQVKKIFTTLDKNWRSICNKDIVVFIDGGQEYTLDFEVLPEMVAQRVLQKVASQEDFDYALNSLNGIFKNLGWSQDILEEVSYD